MPTVIALSLTRPPDGMTISSNVHINRYIINITTLPDRVKGVRYPRPPSPAEGGEVSPAERNTGGYRNDKVSIPGPLARTTSLEGHSGGAAVPGVDANQRDTQIASLVGSRLWTGLAGLQKLVDACGPMAHEPTYKHGNWSSSSGSSSGGRTHGSVTDVSHKGSNAEQGTLRSEGATRGSSRSGLVSQRTDKEEASSRNTRLDTRVTDAVDASTDGEDILTGVPPMVGAEASAPEIRNEAALTLRQASPDGSDSTMPAGLNEATRCMVGNEGPGSLADEASKSNGTPTSDMALPNERSTGTTQPPEASLSSPQKPFNDSGRDSRSPSRAYPPRGGVHQPGQESDQQNPLKTAHPGGGAHTGGAELEAGAQGGRRLAAIVWTECKGLDSEQAALVR